MCDDRARNAEIIPLILRINQMSPLVLCLFGYPHIFVLAWRHWSKILLLTEEVRKAKYISRLIIFILLQLLQFLCVECVKRRDVFF